MNAVGKQLKEERTKKGLTLEEAVRVTKIRKTYLQALEEGDFRAQSPVFMKGFLKSYARFLGLDSAEILSSFDKELRGEEKAEKEVMVETPQKGSRKPLVFGFIVMAIAIVITVVTLYISTREPIPPIAPPPSPVEKEVPSLQNLTTPQMTEAPVGKPLGNMSTITVPPAAEQLVAVATLKPEEKVEDKPVKNAGTAKKHSLSITARGTAWIRVAVDDKDAAELMLKKGETRELTADKKFTVVTGNAGELDLTLDGKALGSLGESGKIVSRVLPE